MRASTMFFLAIFAAMVWSSRVRHGVVHGLRHVCDGVPACRAVPAQQPEDPRVAAVEGEIRGLDQRSRDVDRSLNSISQSERTLREFVRRHPDDSVERELSAITSGGRRLRDLKSQIEARRVVLQARLELVKAGLPDADDEGAPLPSPVDALSSAAVPLRGY
jgi:hypothetical protein